jgi:hypothetical protein
MGNQVSNATFLDGTTGWASPGGLAVDEDVRGAPGRAVLRAGGASALLTSTAALLTGGTSLRAFAHHSTGSRIGIRFQDAGGATVQDFVLPLERSGQGSPRRGLLGTYAFSSAVLPVPVGATKWLFYFSSAIANPVLMKPYGSDDGRPAPLWQPGPHANADLNLPAWPAQFPFPAADTVQVDPIPTRKSFMGDQGVPSTRRITLTQRWKFMAEYSLTAEGRDDLDQFFASVAGPFWFTRPDTRQLCQAVWLEDGEPADRGLENGKRKTQVGLLLKVV